MYTCFILHILLKHSLCLQDKKIANHPEERYSVAKFKPACDNLGLIIPIDVGFAPSDRSGVTPALPLHRRGETQFPQNQNQALEILIPAL